jgi:hypothetical protein
MVTVVPAPIMDAELATASGGLTVSDSCAVAPFESVTLSVTEAGPAGAVNSPAPSTVPPPATIWYVYGGAPPLAACTVVDPESTDSVACAKPTATMVSVLRAVEPPESVTWTTVVPLLDDAVKAPVTASTDPAPDNTV